jgi:hypothetical protein
VILVALAAAGALLPAGLGDATPRCFGAAARDNERPCHNPALEHQVIPTPHEALFFRNAPCEFVSVGPPFVCSFGAGRGGASRHIALIGDSHAVHWRPALLPVALSRNWHGSSLTRAGCPLSAARPILPQRLLPDCLRWRTEIPKWLRRHPEIDTVFVSAHRVRVVGGLGVQVAGYLRAWRQLPQTVRHIVVIRDTPTRPFATRACVIAAIARGLRAGKACAVPRSRSLPADPEARAARLTRDPRVQLADFTRYLCSPGFCYPVVGGALVHKDNTHMTVVFARTMAPFLGRRLERMGL